MKIGFYLLKDNNKNGSGYYIIANTTTKYGRWVRSTGFKLKNLSDWNKKQARVKKNYDDSELINEGLTRIENSLKSLMIANRNANNIDLDKALRGESVSSKTYLMDFIDHFIMKRKESGQYSIGILKVYRVIRNIFLGYESKIGHRLHFNDLNHALLTDLRTYMTKTLKHSHNTISRSFKTLATVINQAKLQGLVVNESYKRFSIPEILTPKIYLTHEDLMKIHLCTYPENIRIAVDIFMILSFTGLRIGNYRYLTKDSITDIRGKEMIVYKLIKSHDQHIVPLHPIVKEIYQKYQGWPTKIAEQTVNEKIKIAGKIAGIDHKVLLDGKYYPKYQLITCHTARRSCATNMHIMGIDHALIKKMTGHKSEKNLLKYIRIDNEDSALLLADTKFFK